MVSTVTAKKKTADAMSIRCQSINGIVIDTNSISFVIELCSLSKRRVSEVMRSSK